MERENHNHEYSDEEVKIAERSNTLVVGLIYYKNVWFDKEAIEEEGESSEEIINECYFHNGDHLQVRSKFGEVVTGCYNDSKNEEVPKQHSCKYDEEVFVSSLVLSQEKSRENDDFSDNQIVFEGSHDHVVGEGDRIECGFGFGDGKAGAESQIGHHESIVLPYRAEYQDKRFAKQIEEKRSSETDEINCEFEFFVNVFLHRSAASDFDIHEKVMEKRNQKDAEK